MNICINKYCDRCHATRVHKVEQLGNYKYQSYCSSCDTETTFGSERKRFVLDGPPGSGKSTVLFGLSDDEPGQNLKHTMVKLNYPCLHESVSEANSVPAKEGNSFETNKELWLSTIIGIDRDKYFKAEEGVTFYDRCFHHWRLLSQVTGIALPDWYDEFNLALRYTNPIFLVAPVKSMDLNSRKYPKSRRYTWQQRLDIMTSAREMYEKLGYEVVEVPMFKEGDINENNRLRIEHILKHIR